ncbi:hypothetical protein F5148DRAFT_1189469, partial [Russula earlei]
GWMKHITAAAACTPSHPSTSSRVEVHSIIPPMTAIPEATSRKRGGEGKRKAAEVGRMRRQRFTRMGRYREATSSLLLARAADCPSEYPHNPLRRAHAPAPAHAHAHAGPPRPPPPLPSLSLPNSTARAAAARERRPSSPSPSLLFWPRWPRLSRRWWRRQPAGRERS